MRIKPDEIRQHGFTIGCPGCRAIRENARAQGHSDECRKRIGDELVKTPAGKRRLEAQEQRLAHETARRRRSRWKSASASSVAKKGIRAGSAPTGSAVAAVVVEIKLRE